MGPRGVFRHDVCGRVQRIVHGIATMRATRVPSRSKSRRADTPSVGPAGCQEVVKSGARVGTPTGDCVPRKRQDGPLLRGEFAHFVLACIDLRLERRGDARFQGDLCPASAIGYGRAPSYGSRK